MKKLILSLAVIAVSLGLAAGAQAATSTTTLDVSFTAITSCTVTTSSVDFGSGIGLSGATGNGDVTVNCSSGTPYNIALDAGLHFTGAWRQISDGSNFRIYELFMYNLGGSEWGDSDHANTYPKGASVADTGTGAAQPHTVYGGLGSGTIIPAGAYSDTVTVTVYY